MNVGVSDPTEPAPSRRKHWARIADLEAVALSRCIRPPMLAIFALLILFIPLLMVGLIPEDSDHGRVAAERSAFATYALIFFMLVFYCSTEVNRVASYFRWHLPMSRGTPVGCHLALAGAAWGVLIGGLGPLLPDEALRIGVPCLLLGWMALPLSLWPWGILRFDRGAVVSIGLSLGGLFLVGSTVVENPLISPAGLAATLSAGVVVSWAVAIGSASLEERLPAGESPVAQQNPFERPPEGRAAVVSLFRTMYGPLWTWLLGLTILAAAVLCLPGKHFGATGPIPLLLFYVAYTVAVIVIGSSSRGIPLSLLVPVGRRKVFDVLHVPGIALLALIAIGWVALAGRVEVSVEPCRELDAASHWVTRVEYRSSGLLGSSWRRDLVRAGNVDVAAEDLSKIVAEDWGYRPEVGEIREKLARAWSGETPDPSRPEDLAGACALVESELKAPVRAASRAMAFLAVVGAGLLAGAGFMLGRRPGGSSMGLIVLMIAAWIGFLSFLLILFVPAGGPWIDMIRQTTVTILVRGWWAILPAWLVAMGWIWFRSRENFALLDVEDAERHLTRHSRFLPLT